MPIPRRDKFPLWRTAKECAHCPFRKDRAGQQMRASLGRPRVAGIQTALRRGQYFTCHETTRDEGWTETEDGDMKYAPVGPELVCAGSIQWAQEHDAPEANLVQVMSRLEIAHARRKRK